jgi:hypothetical protein
MARPTVPIRLRICHSLKYSFKDKIFNFCNFFHVFCIREDCECCLLNTIFHLSQKWRTCGRKYITCAIVSAFTLLHITYIYYNVIWKTPHTISSPA